MKNSPIALDVLMPTCDRPREWVMAMMALRENLTHLPFVVRPRITVGDSGYTPLFADEMARAVWTMVSRCWPCKYVVTGEHAGSAPARDALLDLVQADLYFIQDDDVVFPAGILVRLWRAFEKIQAAEHPLGGVLAYYYDLYATNPVLDSGLHDQIVRWESDHTENSIGSAIPAPHDSSCGLFDTEAVRASGGYHSEALGTGTGVDTLHCAQLEAHGYPLWACCTVQGTHLNLRPRRMQQDDSGFRREVEANPRLRPILRDRWGSAPCLSLQHFRLKDNADD